MHKEIFINWGLARTNFSINTTPKTFRTVAADLLITVLVTSLTLEVQRVFWKFITLIFTLWSCREITGIYKATKTKFVLFTNLILRNLTLWLWFFHVLLIPEIWLTLTCSLTVISVLPVLHFLLNRVACVPSLRPILSERLCYFFWKWEICIRCRKMSRSSLAAAVCVSPSCLSEDRQTDSVKYLKWLTLSSQTVVVSVTGND